MPYIGVAPSSGLFKKLDSITVVNNQAAYTMQHNSSNFSPATAEQLIVSVNGVIQAPGDAYTVSGSTITFSENLVTGDTIDFIVALGEVGNTVTPTDGSVDVNKMSSSIMKDAAIRVNDDELTADVTIAADERAMVSGDFMVSATLTINGVLTIV
jgi:L-ascorbate metabolism protein UlaG (beta-lactamase superfamily)